VGPNDVWVGSCGIYVIDSQTITVKKTLVDHGDELVMDIVLCEDGK